MKIKKIQNKLEFDVEAQGSDSCMHDCPIRGNIPVFVGLTLDIIISGAPGNICKCEVGQGIVGYGPIATEWL